MRKAGTDMFMPFPAFVNPMVHKLCRNIDANIDAVHYAAYAENQIVSLAAAPDVVQDANLYVFLLKCCYHSVCPLLISYVHMPCALILLHESCPTLGYIEEAFCC